MDICNAISRLTDRIHAVYSAVWRTTAWCWSGQVSNCKTHRSLFTRMVWSGSRNEAKSDFLYDNSCHVQQNATRQCIHFSSVVPITLYQWSEANQVSEIFLWNPQNINSVLVSMSGQSSQLTLNIILIWVQRWMTSSGGIATLNEVSFYKKLKNLCSCVL